MSMAQSGVAMMVPLTTGEEAELRLLGDRDFQRQHSIDFDFEALAHWYKWSES